MLEYVSSQIQVTIRLQGTTKRLLSGDGIDRPHCHNLRQLALALGPPHGAWSLNDADCLSGRETRGREWG